MPVFQLREDLIFPPPQLAREDGLLAVGGDLSPERLLLAYRQGIFPWYSVDDPILWWAPTPRLILEPQRFHCSKRLARTIRAGEFRVTMDNAFRETMRQCGEIRTETGDATWIHPDMLEAYCILHELGHAHSVECWQDGELAGGLYGVSLGAVFFGESMFSRVTDSSKVALAHLAACLTEWQFDFIDCQIKTDHLTRLGAHEIAGEQFYPLLAKGIAKAGHPGTWRLDNIDRPSGRSRV